MIFFFTLLIATPIVYFLLYRLIRKNTSFKRALGEYLLIATFVLSCILFIIGSAFNSADYVTAIDPIDDGYTPFASKHIATLIFFFVCAVASIITLWLKGRKLPPLLLVLLLTCAFMGILINIGILIQISSNSQNSNSAFLFSMLPLSYILVTITIFVKIALEESTISATRNYQNKLLNYVNNTMAKVYLQPLWVMILLIPVFIIFVAILALFGQDTHSITKVFTETTTWQLSQKEHPPFLDHKGHYLCTVAACGNPDVVKPILLGSRHGHKIIVNRQLQVANAFEELLQDGFPSLHRVIRNFYDKYGYYLSKKINTPKRSDLIYKLMKPLEYFLLLFYIFAVFILNRKFASNIYLKNFCSKIIIKRRWPHYLPIQHL